MGKVRSIVKTIGKGTGKMGGGVKQPKRPSTKLNPDAAKRRRELIEKAKNQNPAKPKTFESEKREIMGKRMNDRQRQSAMINLAVRYGRPIKIAGMTFGPKKNKAK